MEAGDIYTQFNLRRTEIASLIKNAKSQDELGNIRQNINELMNLIKDPSTTTENSNSSIPSYELKNYSKSVDLLIEELEIRKKEIGGKKKFSFKSKSKPKPQPQKVEASSGVVPIEETVQRKPTHDNISSRLLKIDHSIEQSEYLTNISNSIIKINDSNSIDLKNIDYSIIQLNSRTSLFLTNLNHCIIIGSSQQVRIHHCTDLILILDINKNDEKDKRIIIESCSDLYLDKGKTVHVDDFSFPSMDEVNPHFKYIEIEKETTYTEYSEINSLRNFIDMALDQYNGSN